MDLENNFEIIVLNNQCYFRCNKCKKTFNKKNNAKRHLNNIFNCFESVNYQCKKCDKEFNDKSKYNRHTKSCNYIKTNTIINNPYEILVALYIPDYITDFMTNIYFKYPNINLEITLNNYFNNKNDNIIQELFSFLIRKTKDLNTETLFEIHKTIKKINPKNFINQWNNKLYEEIISSLN